MWRKNPPEPLSSSKDSMPPGSTLPESTDRFQQRPLIGKTLVVKGEVNGDQDLIVNGRIEGNISLPGRTITVRHEGRVTGDILAKMIRVEGSVEGNLVASRVVLEDGCRFRGGIRTTGGGEPAAE